MTSIANQSSLLERRASLSRALSGRMVDRAALAAWLFLLAVFFGPVLRDLVLHWWRDANYSHGFVVPLFSGYVLWRERHRFSGLSASPTNWGLLIAAVAAALAVAGTLGAELFVTRISLLMMATGSLLFLRGWRFLRAAAFPLAFLVFMIPLPSLVENQITFPLQLIASRMAAAALELCGVVVLREGNVLILGNSALEVEAACSGIRSLIGLAAFAVAYGYVTEKRSWMRLLLLAITVPIAVVSNSVRVIVTGLLAYSAGPAWAEGSVHLSYGMLVFLVAGTLLIAVHRTVSLAAPAAGAER